MAKNSRAPYFYLPRELFSQTLDATHVGDKGHRLATLMNLKARVPRFGLLSILAFDEHMAAVEIQEAKSTAQKAYEKNIFFDESLSDVVAKTPLPIRLREAVDALVDAYTERDLLAVRTSISGGLHEVLLLSGYTDTILAIRGKEAVRDAVTRCFASAFSKEVLQRRHEYGLDPFASSMGIVVQRMIDADISGAAASLDVNASEARGPEILVEATFGLCGGMTNNARIDLDLFRVKRPLLAVDELDDKAAIEQEIVLKKSAFLLNKEKEEGTSLKPQLEQKQKQAALSESQIRQVATLALELENELGCPISIDFAFVGRLVHILQLSLLEQPLKRIEGQQERIFSEKNLPRDLLGPTTPLSLSVAKYTLAQGFSQRCAPRTDDKISFLTTHAFGVRNSSLFLNEEICAHLLESLPIFSKKNANRVEGWAPFSTSRNLRKYALNLQQETDAHEHQIRRGRNLNFQESLHDATPDVLLEHLNELLTELCWAQGMRWELDAALEKNIAYLEALMQRFYPAMPQELSVDLLATTSKTHILDFVLALQNLATKIRENNHLRRHFEEGDKLNELSALLLKENPFINENESEQDAAQAKAIADDFNALLERQQERTLCAGKLEAPSLAERKDLVTAWLLAEVRHPAICISDARIRANARRQRAEFLVEEVLGKSRLWGVLKRSSIVLTLTDALRSLIFVREQGQALRKKLYGQLREVFLALGHRLYEHQLIEQNADLWFLELHEVIGALEGSLIEGDLKIWVTERKRKMKKSQQNLPIRFKTTGLSVAAEIEELNADSHRESNDKICFSPGVVVGRLRHLNAHADGRGLQFETKHLLKSKGIAVVEEIDLGLLPSLLRAEAVVFSKGNATDLEVSVMRGLGIPLVKVKNIFDLGAAMNADEIGKGAKLDGDHNELLLLDDKELEKLEENKRENQQLSPIEKKASAKSENARLSLNGANEFQENSSKNNVFLVPEKTQIISAEELERAEIHEVNSKKSVAVCEKRPEKEQSSEEDKEHYEEHYEEPMRSNVLENENENLVVPQQKDGFMEPPPRTQLVKELINE